MKKQEKKNRIFAGIAAAVMAVSATAVGVRSYSANAADLELDNYAKLLQYSLYFYDANMCGDKVGETSAFSWRDNCHTGDVALGGFHDAGDGIKCGQTAGFTASTLGWAYYEYKDQFQKTGTTAHFKVISDEFNEFFKRCTTLSGDTVTSFIYEVGDDGSDHGKWFAPEAMWDHGSSETYSTTDGASDIAAQYAASLAQSYLNFGNEEDLKYAVALYNFATKYRTITYDQNTYANAAKDVQDDISWAAGWLYLATGEEPYLTENSKYTQVQNDWTQDYCYANSQLGAAIINAEITGNWSFATNYIGQKVNANQNQFYVMNYWGSARYNVLMQFCALVASKYEQSGVDYTEWAKNQMNYILGDNNANVCLVVGYNDVSATSPHHRAASNLKVSDDWHEYNNWDGKYSSSNGHVLYGALVGGPTSTDFTSYNDKATDSTSNEVALDYQVGLVAAAAGLYDKYQTGSVVAQIGDEVTVYPDEVAVANGGEVTVTTTTETTTTTTETTTTTTTTEETTTTPEETTTTPEETTTTAEETTTTPEETTATTGEATETTTVEETTTTAAGETTVTEETTTATGETTATEETSTDETTTTTTSGSVLPGTNVGDVNLDGKVDLLDAIYLNKYLAQLITLTPGATANANCDQEDGTETIDDKDTSALMKFILGSEDVKNLPYVG